MAPLTTMLCRILLFAAVAAGSTLLERGSTNASTFVYNEKAATLTLSVTAVASSGDLWFRLSAPASYDWVAFGIGSQMKGALTFVTYPAKNGSAITLSPRLATGHTEPTYNSNIDARKVYVPSDPSANHVDPNNVGVTGQFAISGVCRNCTNWSKPPLDLSSKQAPFMFAVGPISDGTNTRWSDHPDAPLRRHTITGQFTMDMTQATLPSGDGVLVPAQVNVTDGASSTTKLSTMSHDYGSASHAIIMCIAVGLVIPFDSILLRLFHKSLIHYILVGAFSLLFIAGLGLGFYISTEFVRSKAFSSPHQVLGLILMIIFLAQIPIGFLWRQRRLKDETPSPWVRLSHQVLTGIFWILAVVDAALGFNLALAPGYNKVWAPVAIAVFILYLFAFGARLCFSGHRRDRDEALRLEEETANAWKAYHEQQGQAVPQHYGAPTHRLHGGDVELQSYGAEPGVQYSSVQVPKSY